MSSHDELIAQAKREVTAATALCESRRFGPVARPHVALLCMRIESLCDALTAARSQAMGEAAKTIAACEFTTTPATDGEESFKAGWQAAQRLFVSMLGANEIPVSREPKP